MVHATGLPCRPVWKFWTEFDVRLSSQWSDLRWVVTEWRHRAPTTILASAFCTQCKAMMLPWDVPQRTSEEGITIIEARVDDGASDRWNLLCWSSGVYDWGPWCGRMHLRTHSWHNQVDDRVKHPDFIDMFNVDSSHNQNVNRCFCTLLPYWADSGEVNRLRTTNDEVEWLLQVEDWSTNKLNKQIEKTHIGNKGICFHKTDGPESYFNLHSF